MKRLILAFGLVLSLVASNIFGQSSDSLAPSSSPAVDTWNYLFNGVNWERQRAAIIFKNINALVITSESTVWTPISGKRFRLMGMCLTQGVVTGAVTLKDNTAGATILIIPPNTLGASSCHYLGIPGNGILSAAINNVLTATGASTETITGFFFGTEE